MCGPNSTFMLVMYSAAGTVMLVGVLCYLYCHASWCIVLASCTVMVNTQMQGVTESHIC